VEEYERRARPAGVDRARTGPPAPPTSWTGTATEQWIRVVGKATCTRKCIIWIKGQFISVKSSKQTEIAIYSQDHGIDGKLPQGHRGEGLQESRCKNEAVVETGGDFCFIG
jgi:hypothetical protein